MINIGTFRYPLNKKLNYFSIKNNTVNLTFEDCFDQQLIYIPNTVTHITLGKYYNQNIVLPKYCNSLSICLDITFNYKTLEKYSTKQIVYNKLKNVKMLNINLSKIHNSQFYIKNLPFDLKKVTTNQYSCSCNVNNCIIYKQPYGCTYKKLNSTTI